MEWFNLRLNGMVYHVIFIPLLNRLVDIDYPYISDHPSYCIVNLGALAHTYCCKAIGLLRDCFGTA